MTFDPQFTNGTQGGNIGSTDSNLTQPIISQEKIEFLKKVIKKPHVNAECIGCSVCTSLSPHVFEIDDESGLSRVQSLENYEGHDVDDAIAACPVAAISWQQADESGRYFDGVEEHKNVEKK